MGRVDGAKKRKGKGGRSSRVLPLSKGGEKEPLTLIFDRATLHYLKIDREFSKIASGDIDIT